MPTQSSAFEPSSASLFVETRVAALWAFVQAKARRFTLDDAVHVISDLQLKPDDDHKAFAKRLRVALLARGVNLKHTHALQAAAQLYGNSSFHKDESVRAPKLRLTTFCGPSMELQDGTFPTWNELTEFVREVSDNLLANGLLPLGVMTVRFNGKAFEFWAPMRSTQPEDHRVVDSPLFQVAGLAPDWLAGAPAFVEKLRRHMEERGRAVLDGAEVIHLCADQPPPRGTPGEICLTDAPNSELVLLREDHEDHPASGYEIARGDEITCWHQLELSMRDDINNTMPALDITVPQEGTGAWIVNGIRYVWALETLHPKEYVPGLSTWFVGPDACSRLLRRYKLAKHIHGNSFKHHPLNKPLAYLSGAPDTYRVDLHYLMFLIKDAGLTWEQCVEQFSADPLEMQPVLPVGFVFQLLEKLKVPDPNKVFALPNMAEMSRVDDDGLLRALLPRVESVRAVRPWGMSEEEKQALNGALETFGAGRHLQILTAGGSIRSEQELPYFTIASDAEELRGSVNALGFVPYAAVTPHLISTKGVLPSAANSWPWALGNALFLRFERRGDSQ